MNIRQRLLISAILLSMSGYSQELAGIYKIGDLLGRISNNDTTYVVNFWALWCKPCIQEIPSFDSLNTEFAGKKMKVLLVNLDFLDGTEKKVNAFLLKNNIKAECVLLDEIDGNSYINKISEEWSGAIPATLFKKTNERILIEHKLNLKSLRANVTTLTKK